MVASYRPNYDDDRPPFVGRRRSRSPDRDRARATKRPRTDTDSYRHHEHSPTETRPNRIGNRPFDKNNNKNSPRHGQRRSRSPLHLENGDNQHNLNLHPSRRPTARSSSSSTQRDRTSLSAKIHNLRRLLQHPHSNMPATVRADKERELASYVLEQEAAKSAKIKSKRTGQYHFVRFLDRKKAEKALKGLQKQREDATAAASEKDSGEARVELERRIHDATVDVAYTIYAPLNAKYIALFPQQAPGKSEGPKISCMKKSKQRLLSAEERRQLIAQQEEKIQRQEEKANVLRNESGLKPPLWDVVRQLMGDDKALERLRDQEGIAAAGSGGQVMTVGIVGGKRKRTSEMKDSEDEGEDWMRDDGLINPQDLDSEDDDYRGGVRVEDRSQGKGVIEDEDEDGDQDMSDGSFFERG